MDYTAHITTPLSTAATAPVTTRIKVDRGFLRAGWIYFPVGPSGLLHCQLFHGNSQIAPANRGASFNLNNVLMPFLIGINIDEPPFEITVVTWNLSTDYDHTCNVLLSMDSKL